MLDFLKDIPHLDLLALLYAVLAIGMVVGIVLALDWNQASTGKRRRELAAELEALRATERLAQTAWSARQAMQQAAEEERRRRQVG